MTAVLATSLRLCGATGSFDGWNEYFSYDRWVACCERELEPLGVSLGWFTTRERDYEEVLPWDHLDSGLDRDWLWDDWQDALDGEAVNDCRWNPCYDCGFARRWAPRFR